MCDNKTDCFFEEDEKNLFCKKKFSEDCESKSNGCLLQYDLFRVPMKSIGDLTTSLGNCNRSHCNRGEYLCQEYNYCIKIEQYCDGIHDCLLGDDEINCGLHL